MKLLSLVLNSCFFIFYFSTVVAQPNYFQQSVNYKIDVKLNDVTHTLDGFIEISYTNNSPYQLDFLYFHLWPNAYKNNQTAFAKQMIENKNTSFWFSKPEQKGYINKLDFRVDGDTVKWQLDSINIDIAKVNLQKPLKTGETITITTPFFVKLPNTFSRLGHEDQSYQITQWYPKPAVFDADGWHPLPYLDQGEFYSEYGSFDVKISLPKNYVVGATGYLQDSSEQLWLDKKAAATATLNDMQLKEKKSPVSDSTFKTLNYKIDKVHDFAWFADKRYHVLKSEITLPESQRKVTTYAMFTRIESKLWKEATNYINEGLLHYSKYVGEYPYNVCTAVQGALKAGGGMEYPTITIIGTAGSAKSLETVIVHEVGHNWFMGVLGNNERLFPWMEEGINSFYEQQYMKAKYPEEMLIGKDKGVNKFLSVEAFKSDEFLKLVYEYLASNRKSQALNLRCEVYTENNFGGIVYGKGAWAMEYLQAYLGKETFDKAMHAYFEKWQFKHPKPENLKASLENSTGKNLDWFFNTLLSNEEDAHYQLKAVKKQDDNTYNLKVVNKNHLPFPVSVGTYNFKENKYQTKSWMDGFKNDTIISISKENKKEMFCLDCEKNIPTANRSQFFKRKKLSLKFLAAYDRPNRTEIFFTPWITWNNYDKTMFGLAIYNHTIPNKKFTYELAPQYAIGTKTAVGMGRVAYSFYLKESKIKQINIALQGRRFGWQVLPEAYMYNKLQPTLTFDIKSKTPRSHIQRTLVLRSVNVWQQQKVIKEVQLQHYYVNEAAFYCENKKALNPISWQAHIQQGQEFVKLFAEANFTINYNKPKKALYIRYFIGGFPWQNITGNLPDPRFRMNFSSGFGPFVKDYTFDEFLLGRSDGGGFFSQQILNRDGGFRTITNFGQTSMWLTSVNISTNIPTKIPIKPFISIGVYGDKNNAFNIAFEAGITVYIIKDIIEFNLPIASFIQADFGTGKETYKWSIAMKKDDTENVNNGVSYRNLITFNFNLSKLNPFTKLKNLEF